MSISQEDSLSLADLQCAITLLGFQSNLEVLQRRILEGVCQVFVVETAALFLVDETNREWLVRKALSNNVLQDKNGEIQRQPEWSTQVDGLQGKGLVRECLRSCAPVLTNQVQEDRRFDPSNDAPVGLHARSMLCVPLVADGRLLGALQLINKREGEFDRYDLDLLVRIVAQAAATLQGAALLQQLRASNLDLEASRRELMNSRDTLRILFDHLPMALYIVDNDYRLLAINQSRSHRVNQSPESLENQVCYRALFNRLEPCGDCRVKETFKDGASTQRTERRSDHEPVKELDRRGEEGIEWEIYTYPIFNEQDVVLHSIVMEQDVTEKYHLENILARSEKLAVIGQLAAGVAHEINNPLTAIIANAQILHRGLPTDHDLQESVDLISRAGARAAQVVRNLLDFARKEDNHLGFTDVNETVERALELIRHELMSRGVRLKFKPDSSLPSILASEDHLQSVWLNLLLNAIDALDKEPGTVTVTTHMVGSDIYIAITDNGKGIPPERLARIFEPFYTTKAPGRGTGLGLSVSHRIVKQHGGIMRVESKVGEGSEFTVILPAG